MGQIFFGAKSARAKYEFGQICLGPTNYLRNWRWPIFLDQLLLGPNADNPAHQVIGVEYLFDTQCNADFAKILIMILELGESLRHKEILALGLLLKWTND